MNQSRIDAAPALLRLSCLRLLSSVFCLLLLLSSGFCYCHVQPRENLERHLFRALSHVSERPHARRAAGFAGAAGDEFAGARHQVAVHPEQRLAEADAAGVVVVDEHPGLVAVLESRRPRRGGPRGGGRLPVLRGLPRGADGDADVARVAHQQQLRDLAHGVRHPHHAVPAVVAAERQRGHELPRDRQPVRRRVHLALGKVELARPDVLVRVELDLLEPHDARHDVHVAVRRERPGPLARRGGRVERRDAAVRDGVGVVVAVDVPDVRLAALEVELLHLVQPALHDVDGLLVEDLERGVEVGLPDHARRVGLVHDDEVVRRHRAQADRVGRVRLVRPVPVAGRILGRAGLAEVHEALFRQDAEDLLQVLPAVRLGGRERQLERGALDVIDQDLQVVGVDEGVLGRRVEEVRRVADHELVERRARRHHHRRRPARPPPGPAEPLPRRRDRARVARQHRDVERADVDAELERVGRHDAAHGPVAQPFLDLAPPVRQVAAAVAADHVRLAGRALVRVLQVPRQDLGREPALREHDHLQALVQELEGHRPRLRDVRPADAELPVHDRRVHEDEPLLAARRAALLDQLERPFGEALRQLHRVGDRRRRADERRRRPVVLAHAAQPPEHVPQVAAEHAAVRVQLVDDDVAQVLEELGPLRVVRQHARVQHVGVGQHDVRAPADGAARVLRRVAVVREHADLDVGRPRDFLGEPIELRQLILREGLGREEVERPRGGIREDPVHHRDVVAQRLARRRRRGHHHVAAGQRVLDRAGLVGVEAVDAAPRQGGAQPGVDARREVLVAGVARGHAADGRDEAVGLVGPLHRALARHDLPERQVERRVAPLVATGQPRLRRHTRDRTSRPGTDQEAKVADSLTGLTVPPPCRLT